jgi:hypothetical protein
MVTLGHGIAEGVETALSVPPSAGGRCRRDELRTFLRPRTRHNQPVPDHRRRLLHLRRATAALVILEAA